MWGSSLHYCVFCHAFRLWFGFNRTGMYFAAAVTSFVGSVMLMGSQLLQKNEQTEIVHWILFFERAFEILLNIANVTTSALIQLIQ